MIIYLALIYSRQIFCDFGEKFVVKDVNGEQPETAMIASISKVYLSLLTLLYVIVICKEWLSGFRILTIFCFSFTVV